MRVFIKHYQDSISKAEIRHFFRQLATLISAGVNLMQSLSILTQATNKAAIRRLIQNLTHQLESGKELHLCLQKFPHFFDLFCCQLVRIGEHTGTLDLMLSRIASYQEKNAALNSKLKQALFYPTLIFLASLIMILIMLLLVVPHFAELFEHFPKELPALTKAIIYLSSLLRKSGACLLFLALGTIITVFRLRKTRQALLFYQKCIFQLPYLRKLVLTIALAKFTRNLATALSAALPLTEALMMVAQLSPLKNLSSGIRQLNADVQSGKRFYLALAANKLFPPLLIQMVRTGEDAGKLELMLEKFADLYEADIEHFMTSFTRMLEPLIIAILGVLIGVVVIAMYLPIFRLGTAI